MIVYDADKQFYSILIGTEEYGEYGNGENFFKKLFSLTKDKNCPFKKFSYRLETICVGPVGSSRYTITFN